MSEPERYQLLISWQRRRGKIPGLAHGQIGTTHGRRRAQIDRRLLSKHELSAQQKRHLERKGRRSGPPRSRFGTVTGSSHTDMKRLLARKRAMVDSLIAIHLDKYKASGAELIMGMGRFIGPKTIEATLTTGGTRVLTGDRVVLNLGHAYNGFQIYRAWPRQRR